MSTEANIDVVCQWVEEVWNNGNLDRIGHFQPPTFENEGSRSTVEEAKEWHRSNRSAFPDIHYTIVDIFATEDRVAVRWRATATHSGMLWNMISPTDKTITWNGMHLLRLANQQIIEVWALQNTVAQLQQMGVTLQQAPAGLE
ncbi:MAG: ester cyclase [Chloroflexota bacterium]